MDNKENNNINIAAESQGLNFKVFIDSKKGLYSSGSNVYGELGCGLKHKITQTIPHRILIK